VDAGGGSFLTSGGVVAVGWAPLGDVGRGDVGCADADGSKVGETPGFGDELFGGVRPLDTHTIVQS